MKASNGVVNAASFLLALKSITQSALIGRANSDGKTGEEPLLVENGTFIKEMRMSHATKHAMSELRAFTSELVNEGWHAVVHGCFEFGVVVMVRFFAKRIDSALKGSTTAAVAR